MTLPIRQGCFRAAAFALATFLLVGAQALRARPAAAQAPSQRPNILVIFGDDIGYWNLSIYNQGMMGYRTPNIDRIGHEGMMFTDAYAQQSCTAGRAAFITGQSPLRTGLLRIGLPGSPEGLSKADPTIAEMLKPLGYVTGQFGKNHLGDRDEFLPTVHGFDEFFGNLYHLNAEEEPEDPDYPKNAAFAKQFGPRGVIHSWALPDGKQKVVNTGPLTRKRMETIDDEFAGAAMDFIDRAHQAHKPFFVWMNTTRMHIWTHLKPSSRDKTGLGIEADGMVEHDALVGKLLKQLDDLGISKNTIVLYTTDNGAEVFSWPDGGTTPFRSEKNSVWEGGYRVPELIRWPGHIAPGTVSNGIISHEDWFPTFLAAAGEPDVSKRLLTGYQIGNTDYRVHIDGVDQLDWLLGKSPSARNDFFYWTDGGDLAGLRFDRWKFVFLEQRAIGFNVWTEPAIPLRVPLLFDLLADPFERAQLESSNYDTWMIRHMYLAAPAQAYVLRFLQTFKEFPPRQKPGSFSLQDAAKVLGADTPDD